MKKVAVEKLVSKMMIVTTAILGVLLGMWLIQEGYCNNYNPKIILAMPAIVSGISILFLVAAIVFVVLTILKKIKSFELATWFAALATFTMLLNINYSVKALELAIPNVGTIKFFAVSLYGLLAAIVVIWIYTIYRIIRY